MAQKDWKKYPTGLDWALEWRNQHNLQRITIYRRGLLPKTSEWDVTIESVESKTFKTKSQALAYARQYMRTH